MLEFLVSWALSAAALTVANRVFSGVSLQGDFADALWVAALYAVLSFCFGWFVFGFLGFVTLGLGFIFFLFTKLVAAAIILKMTSALSSRFSIRGFVPALGTAIMLALASGLGERLLGGGL